MCHSWSQQETWLTADLSFATNNVTIYLSRPSPDVVATIHGAEVLLLTSHLSLLAPACLIHFRSVF